MVKIERDGCTVLVTEAFHVKEAVKELGFRWDSAGKAWWYNYRHTDVPSGGSKEYVFILTSKGQEYQFCISKGFQVL